MMMMMLTCICSCICSCTSLHYSVLSCRCVMLICLHRPQHIVHAIFAGFSFVIFCVGFVWLTNRVENINIYKKIRIKNGANDREQWRRQDFVSGGRHRFGVVKRPKIINVYRTTPGSNLYSRVCVIVLGLCVIHIQCTIIK